MDDYTNLPELSHHDLHHHLVDDWLNAELNDVQEDDAIVASLQAYSGGDEDDHIVQRLLSGEVDVQARSGGSAMRASFSMNDLASLQRQPAPGTGGGAPPPSSALWNSSSKLASSKPRLQSVPEGVPTFGGPLNLLPLANGHPGGGATVAAPAGDALAGGAALAGGQQQQGREQHPLSVSLRVGLEDDHMEQDDPWTPGGLLGANGMQLGHEGGLAQEAVHRHHATIQTAHGGSVHVGCGNTHPASHRENGVPPNGVDPSLQHGGPHEASGSGHQSSQASMLRKSQSAVDLTSWRGLNGAMEDAWGANGDNPWKLSAEERVQRIQRYREKRLQRNYQRAVKYQCRKSLADTRPRVKGRFARNDDASALLPHEAKKTPGGLPSHNHQNQQGEPWGAWNSSGGGGGATCSGSQGGAAGTSNGSQEPSSTTDMCGGGGGGGGAVSSGGDQTSSGAVHEVGTFGQQQQLYSQQQEQQQELEQPVRPNMMGGGMMQQQAISPMMQQQHRHPQQQQHLQQHPQQQVQVQAQVQVQVQVLPSRVSQGPQGQTLQSVPVPPASHPVPSPTLLPPQSTMTRSASAGFVPALTARHPHHALHQQASLAHPHPHQQQQQQQAVSRFGNGHLQQGLQGGMQHGGLQSSMQQRGGAGGGDLRMPPMLPGPGGGLGMVPMSGVSPNGMQQHQHQQQQQPYSSGMAGSCSSAATSFGAQQQQQQQLLPSLPGMSMLGPSGGSAGHGGGGAGGGGGFVPLGAAPGQTIFSVSTMFSGSSSLSNASSHHHHQQQQQQQQQQHHHHHLQQQQQQYHNNTSGGGAANSAPDLAAFHPHGAAAAAVHHQHRHAASAGVLPFGASSSSHTSLPAAPQAMDRTHLPHLDAPLAGLQQLPGSHPDACFGSVSGHSAPAYHHHQHHPQQQHHHHNTLSLQHQQQQQQHQQQQQMMMMGGGAGSQGALNGMMMVVPPPGSVTASAHPSSLSPPLPHTGTTGEGVSPSASDSRSQSVGLCMGGGDLST